MISYDLAIVEDRGSYWHVMGVTKNSLSTADSSEQYLKLSHVAYKKIQEAIMEGDLVKITKPLRVGEVLPDEVKITKVEEDDVVSVRESAIKRVRMIITPQIASLSGLSMYGFICLNNELADKGFFITDENRESKYLSILETGDEKLIQKLEDYLNYRDEISRISSLYKKFETFRKEVMNETDRDKITKLSNDFLTTYYSNY